MSISSLSRTRGPEVLHRSPHLRIQVRRQLDRHSDCEDRVYWPAVKPRASLTYGASFLGGRPGAGRPKREAVERTGILSRAAARPSRSDVGPGRAGTRAGGVAGPVVAPAAGGVAGRATGRTAGPAAGRIAGGATGPAAGRGTGRVTAPIAGETPGRAAGGGAGQAAGRAAGPIAGGTTGPAVRPIADGIAGRALGRRAGPTTGGTTGPTMGGMAPRCIFGDLRRSAMTGSAGSGLNTQSPGPWIAS